MSNGSPRFNQLDFLHCDNHKPSGIRRLVWMERYIGVSPVAVDSLNFMKPSDFKIGDRVLISGTVPGTNIVYDPPRKGLVKVVNGPNSVSCDVYKEDGKTYHDRWFFHDDNLQLDPQFISPQSPQPQTTQQKEDTVMYSVINYSHLTGGVNVTNYNTEAEAKTFAERTIASYRSNIQVKQYFTVAVVELKTGKLVGSVVDAPPAVDWATS